MYFIHSESRSGHGKTEELVLSFNHVLVLLPILVVAIPQRRKVREVRRLISLTF